MSTPAERSQSLRWEVGVVYVLITVAVYLLTLPALIASASALEQGPLMASAKIVALFLLVVILPGLRSVPQIERRVSPRAALVLLLFSVFAAIIWIAILVLSLNFAFASDAPRDWQTHLHYGSRLLLWSCTSWGLVLSAWCAAWFGRRRGMLGASIVAVLGSALIITCARFVVTAPAM